MSRHRERCDGCGKFTTAPDHDCIRHRCDGCGRYIPSEDAHQDCEPSPDSCTVGACDDPVDARGMCARHYKRWHKHGDPTYVTPRDEYAQRSDTATCPSIQRYHDGCRCLQCRVMWADYQARWKAGELPPRPLVEDATELLEELLASRFDIDDIVANTTLSRSTVYRWLRGEGTHAARRAFESLAEWHAAVTAGPIWLDVQPLVDAVEATGIPLARLFTESDRGTYLRARREGRITDVVADRIAVAALGQPLELIYGTDYDSEAA